MGDPLRVINGKVKANLNKLTDQNFDGVKVAILDYLNNDAKIKEVIKAQVFKRL